MPIRGIGTNSIPPPGGFRVRKHAYTLATFTAAGTHVPAVGDYVTPSNGANDRVVIAADNTAGFIGKVIAVQVPDLTVDVEWYDVYAFVELPCSSLAGVTLLDSGIKNGDTTVLADFDAGATTGNLIAISKSAATGAGTFCCAVLITGK